MQNLRCKQSGLWEIGKQRIDFLAWYIKRYPESSCCGLLRLNTLHVRITTFLTPKKFDRYTCPFYGSPPPQPKSPLTQATYAPHGQFFFWVCPPPTEMNKLSQVNALLLLNLTWSEAYFISEHIGHCFQLPLSKILQKLQRPAKIAVYLTWAHRPLRKNIHFGLARQEKRSSPILEFFLQLL